MKVLFIHNSVAEYRLEFWRLLSKKCELQLLITDKTLEQKAYGFEKDLTGLTIAYLSPENYRGWLDKAIEYDVMVLPPVDSKAPYVISKDFIRAARKGNTKVVMWTEAWKWHKLPLHKVIMKGYVDMLRKRIFNQSDACIVAGTCAYNYMKSLGCDERKLFVAYDSSTSPVSNMKDIRAKHGLPENCRIVLYLGRMMRQKGLDLLIEAFEKISKQNPQAYLLIGGDGGFREYCEQLASKMQSKERIKFIGKVQPDTRASYYRESDMLVLPTHEDHGEIEIWGLSVNESLEQGCPVVTTTAAGSVYDLIDDTCGKIVKEKDVDDLSNGIQYILDKPKGYFADNCKKRYSKYSVKNMAESFYKVFVNLVKH